MEEGDEDQPRKESPTTDEKVEPESKIKKMTVKERREAARLAKLPKEWKFTEEECNAMNKKLR